MKFVLAFWGTRGEVEPCVAVGRELVRRGHDVRMAVSPDLVGFTESAGLAAVAYGPDLQRPAGPRTATSGSSISSTHLWRVQELSRLWREYSEPLNRVLGELSSDADVAGGRGRPAIHRHDLRGRRRQRRGVLQHSVRHAALSSRCGPTASSCRSCRRRWAAPQ